MFIATQLNSTWQREQQLTQFVGHDVINKSTTDLAVRRSTGSVELSWVELCRYKHPLRLWDRWAEVDETWRVYSLGLNFWEAEFNFQFRPPCRAGSLRTWPGRQRWATASGVLIGDICRMRIRIPENFGVDYTIHTSLRSANSGNTRVSPAVFREHTTKLRKMGKHWRCQALGHVPPSALDLAHMYTNMETSIGSGRLVVNSWLDIHLYMPEWPADALSSLIFLCRVSTLTRDIDIGFFLCPSVCPSIHPSVTFRYWMKTA